ncbi:MAG: hypothetical protein Tsb0032_23960 [Kiloniellaceae bacterium]
MCSDNAAQNPNRHVFEYLHYYTSLSHPPKYAVLLTGAWGVGKTFLVKSFLSGIAEHRDLKYVYVSLHGLSTHDEIDGALFQAIFPSLGWKGTKIGTKLLHLALKRFGLDPEIRLQELLNKFTSDLYVFDDLERFEGKATTALGYINEFVEQAERKVVVVAHDEKITEESYRERREKLIGKTLEIQPSLSEAFHFFLSAINDHRARALLLDKSAEICTLFVQSQLNNLRVLQQTMWDFERVIVTLEDKHLDNDDAMTQLLQLLLPLSFEVKAGRMSRDDLSSRPNAIFAAMARRRGEEDLTPFLQAADRYPGIDLSDSILSDHLLEDILIKGIVDPNEVRVCIDRSRFFTTPDSEPPWHVLWDLFNRTDDEFEAALDSVRDQIEGREIENIGELLHIFGIMLTLSEIGLIDKSTDEVVQGSESYIDELLSQNRLAPLSPSESDFDLSRGYGGYGYQSNDTPAFKSIYNYVKLKRTEAYKAQYPKLAEDLMREMESDTELYFRRITLTNSDDNTYYDVPILEAVDVERFSSILIGLPPKAQHLVLSAFRERYQHGGLTGSLATELPWLRRVHERLKAILNSLRPVSKARLERYTRVYIEPFIR